MTQTVAVVAHFDPNNRIDDTFRSLLACLNQHCDRIVLVTTCKLPQQEIPTDASIITIQRPNIGYDFYSYRVGINEIIRTGGCEKIFVLNSSFVVLNRQLFLNALTTMLDKLNTADVVGMTKSFQFEPHLQSYLLLINGSELGKAWFQEWLQYIEPRSSKFETILANELGFAKAIKTSKIPYNQIFELNWIQSLKAYFAWGKRLIQMKGIQGVLHRQIIRSLKEFNPVHFSARSVAEQFGIVKAELIRDNPHGLNLDWLETVISDAEKASVQKLIEQSRYHYQSTGNGLTEFKVKSRYLPSCQLICSGPLARPGIRVAVIVHVFYPELISEISDLLRNIIEPFDLFVTTPHEGAIPAIFDTLAPIAQCVGIALCENRGRDIGPFLAIHRGQWLEPYQAVLKLHTKKSTYSDQGSSWRQSLFNELCGNSFNVLRTIKLLKEGEIGIVGPHSCYLTHPHFWGADKANAQALLNSMDIQYPSNNPPLGFFAGSMFWFNPMALKALHMIPEEQLSFEPEHGQQDGTLAHAFERIFCNVVRNAGFVATSVDLGGAEIDGLNTYANSVPVLDLPKA